MKNFLTGRPPQARFLILGVGLLAVGLLGWTLDRPAFLAAWLAGWTFCTGIVLGGLANVWLHNLTGGAWGEAIRYRLLATGRLMPWLALLFLPVLLGMGDLYPWAAAGQEGHWLGEQLSAPGFKRAWLQPGLFVLRAVAILALWCALAWASRHPRLERSSRFAAAALITYGFSVGLAAVDWIMSLMPLWYSSSFGLLVGMGQLLVGMALAILLCARSSPPAGRTILRDLGNLLLAYVLTWAYLAFTQYLIIWSENLPHEIAWYVVRLHSGWRWVGLALAVFHFGVPLLILLFRAAKDSARLLGVLAAGLLAAHALHVCWLVLPSVSIRGPGWHVILLVALILPGLAALCIWLAPGEASLAREEEVRHA